MWLRYGFGSGKQRQTAGQQHSSGVKILCPKWFSPGKARVFRKSVTGPVAFLGAKGDNESWWAGSLNAVPRADNPTLESDMFSLRVWKPNYLCVYPSDDPSMDGEQGRAAVQRCLSPSSWACGLS